MSLKNFDNLSRLLNPASPEGILVVDDDHNVCKSIQTVLATVGLVSDAVHSVAEAVAALDRQAYCVVLLDLNMPGAEGIELIDHINRHEIDTCVIVVSGASEINKAINVIKSGARDFIRKPYNPDELLISIKNALESRNLETENRIIVEELKRSEALHRFIVHNSPDLLYIIDRDGHFSFINNNVTELLGYKKKEVIGRHFSDFVYEKDIERAKAFFSTRGFPNDSNCIELRLRSKGKDSFIFVEVRAIQIERNFVGGYKLNGSNGRSDADNFVGVYGTARDITDRKRAEEIIRFQHNHDLLTGLPNRNLLNEQISILLNHAKRNSEGLAILLIDIDRFKLVNDSYGQAVGDQVLRFVAENLNRGIRESDFLARFGGDEFILLLPDIKSAHDAMNVAKKIVKETCVPFRYGKTDIHITLSIGIALYPDHGNSWEQLLKNADTAVCNLRLTANSNFCIYNDSLKNHNSNKISIENLIRTAIKEDQFISYYQPQINLETGEIHALEALGRINSPDHGLVRPAKFIEIAEESSLICDVGDVILTKVCEDVKRWQAYGYHVPVSINISAIQLAMDSFSSYFLEKIHRFGLFPEIFELEITENVIIKNLEMTLNNIIKLTKLGVNIAIDDFGKGYSSLSYLDQLPLKTLKLDKSFIRNINVSDATSTIIPAMINVANGLKLNFVAEGVETRTQHEYLIEQGSCIAQGYYYSKPVGIDKIIEFMQNFDPSALQVTQMSN